MSSKTTIKQVLAVFMLLLFAFSITPKKQIHDLVANHQDTRANKQMATTDANQVHQAGINCICDQLIVESPFSCAIHSFSIQVVVFQNSYYQKPSHFSFVAPLISIGLRGPPSIVI